MTPERLVPGTVEWEVLEAEHRQRYEFFAARAKGLRVLDVACGVGYGSQMLAACGAASVTGVDISAEAIESARKHFAHPSVEFIACDASGLARLGREFDMAVSFETVEHLAEPEVLLREVQRVLTPGGCFVCSTPNRDYERRSGTRNPYHLCEWTYDEFHDAFSQYFEIEGKFHQSPSAAYLRHLELLSEIEGIQKKLRFSVAFRVESALRRALGKEQLNGYHLAETLWRITPGDYLIEPIVQPSRRHVTFILAGRQRGSRA
jgi:ubiquinone/menaquinone biosynthesis C-methylase UbiE